MTVASEEENKRQKLPFPKQGQGSFLFLAYIVLSK